MQKNLPFEDDLERAVEVLRKGGIILYPSDTIWGIGTDATDYQSVERIYRIKKRDKTKSLLVILDSEEKLFDYVEDIPLLAWDLLKYSQQPLTIIYPKAKNLATNLLADDGSIGIRVVKDDFASELVRRFGKPIVSTSANFSGQKPPVNFMDIDEKLKNMVDYVVSWRQKDRSRAKPSAIIKLGYNNYIKIIRQ